MKKPRNKAYKPKPILADPLSWAIAGAHTLPAPKQAELLAPVSAALLKLQHATADRDDWNTLANALNLAEALCGLQIGPNLLPEITKGMEALHAVAMRMLASARSTCRGAEIAAIVEALDMYRAQLQLCSQAEMSRAVARVKDLHRSGAMDRVAQIYRQMDLNGRAT